MTTFKSRAVSDASLPLGTPLNKYQPNWPEWRHGVTPHPRDAVMLTGDQHSRCPSCNEYFNSVYAFDQHRVGLLGSPQRRCLRPLEMHSSGWTQSPKGHWRTPRKGAGAQSRSG